jgi:hypothetical protein
MLKISFDFDETTKKVSNMKVVTISKEVEELPTIEVLDNKSKLSDSALKKMGVSADDRLSVEYWTVDNQTTFPIIGKSEVFTDSENGNRLTKSKTLSFKGQQRTILLEYGNFFRLEEFKENMYKLVPINLEEDDLKNEENDLSKLDNDLFGDFNNL